MIYIYSLIFIFLISCNSSQKIVFDKSEVTYVYSRPSMEGTEARLTLSNEQQFRFYSREGLLEMQGGGYYKIDKVNLFLNSDANQISKNGKVEATHIPNQSFTTLKFVDASKTPINNLKVMLDGKVFTTDSLGAIKVSFPITSIYSAFYLDYSFFYGRKGNMNNLEIQLLPNDNSEVYFINSEYRIGKDKLTDDKGRVFLKE